MSITRSFSKRSQVYYAYDTQYIWDETTQKKIQVKKCIGKFDPITGELIPNGKRGRKPLYTKEAREIAASNAVVLAKTEGEDVQESLQKAAQKSLETYAEMIASLESAVSALSIQVDQMKQKLRELQQLAEK